MSLTGATYDDQYGPQVLSRYVPAYRARYLHDR